MSTISHSQWASRTALFGGVFDPPHAGHLAAARELRAALGFQHVLILPTGTPNHKKAYTSSLDRLALCRAHFEPEFEVLDEEIKFATAQPSSRNTTFDTLTRFGSKYGEIAFVIGTDQWIQFAQWHRFQELLELCHWVILQRAGIDETQWRTTTQQFASASLIRPVLGDSGLYQSRVSKKEILFFRTQAPAQSSTELRASIAKTGQIPAESMPNQTKLQIQNRGLYGTDRTRI